MSKLSIQLFGKFCIHCDGQVINHCNSRKTQELFSYLLLYRDRPHRREALVNLLWGDCPAAQAKKSLRQALWQLQASLASPAKGMSHHLFSADPEWIQLSTPTELWLDIAVFEQTFAQVQGVPGEALELPAFQRLQQVIDLYQGDLLEGWYAEWCLYERERFQNMYLAILDKLVACCEAHAQYETGLVYGMRMLRCDYARERTHRQMMRLHYLAGDRTAALRQYERCAAALEQELGVKPSQRTVALYEQIQADAFVSYRGLKPVATPPPSTSSTLPVVLDHLKQLQSTLAGFQHQLDREIQTVELVLQSPP